jgi:hypothetical protein
MKKIELFIQCEGIKDIVLIEVLSTSTIRDLLKRVKGDGIIPEDFENLIVYLEDEEHHLDLDRHLDAAGVQHRKHVHIHRCHKVEITVNFNGQVINRSYSPSTTIKHVWNWATGSHGFNLAEVDASEHALQVCGTNNRPDEDVHIGTLIVFPHCKISFDLVPKKRVEG